MKKNITLTGMMGAGKSLIAELLCRELDGYFSVDIDVLIENMQKRTISEIFATDGETFFRDLESEILQKTYVGQNMIVALGGGAFEREKNRQIIKESSLVIYLKANPETLFERVRSCNNRPLLKKGFGVEEVRAILARREENYLKADYTIVTDEKSANEIVQEILGLING